MAEVTKPRPVVKSIFNQDAGSPRLWPQAVNGDGSVPVVEDLKTPTHHGMSE
jgi:hypothetical protein